MLDISRTSFYIKSAVFERDEFERYSTHLFDLWDEEVERHLNLPDYALSLVIEEGSIRGSGKIAAAATALYLAIGQYGSFVSGLQVLNSQASYLTETLFNQAKVTFGCKSTRGNTRSSGGEVAFLRNLFERVQSGVLSTDQAILQVRERWSQEDDSSQALIEELSASLSDAPRFHEQLRLGVEAWEPPPEHADDHRRPQPPAPKQPPSHVLPQHYRIEIFRRSKQDEKSVLLTELK